jgi:hypothetical protein
MDGKCSKTDKGNGERNRKEREKERMKKTDGILDILKTKSEKRLNERENGEEQEILKQTER